jgi:methionyl-tRNA formyltransferase
MRLVFAGTPEFAERALAALLAAGHRVDLILTQPDRAAGRGLRMVQSPVKRFALEHGLEIFQPTTLSTGESIARLRRADPEALVVAAYGMILPAGALEVAPRGALNIHASLLPRWRGAAPVQRALLAGDRETGITIMQMDSGLDTGPILAQRALAIAPDDDSQTLLEKLASLGAEMIVAVLADLADGRVHARPQATKGVAYAHKIGPREAMLDWRLPAQQVERAVRAFRPSPGAFSELRGASIKIWRARETEGSGLPGTVLALSGEALLVSCGNGALAVTELQRAGGKRLPAAEFMRGFSVHVGERFALPEKATPG